jgi:hypothetical protein
LAHSLLLLSPPPPPPPLLLPFSVCGATQQRLGPLRLTTAQLIE